MCGGEANEIAAMMTMVLGKMAFANTQWLMRRELMRLRCCIQAGVQEENEILSLL